MNTSNLKKSAFVLFILMLLIFQNAKAHQLGLTVTNLKYSKETVTLSTRIFYADFFMEFQQYAKAKNKNYAVTGVDDKDKKDFTKYFKKNIRLWVNRSEIKFNTIKISFERHEEDAYILLIDLSYKAEILPGSKVKIKNTVLLKSILGQKHVVNVMLKDGINISHGLITLDQNSPEYEFENN